MPAYYNEIDPAAAHILRAIVPQAASEVIAAFLDIEATRQDASRAA